MEVDWNYISMQILVNKDRESFHKLFNHFYTDLVHFSQSIITERELAEDVVSDIMLKIWSGDLECKNIRNIKTYLYQATKNSSLNVSNHNKIRQKYIDANQEEPSTPGPDQLLIDKELKFSIDKAINNLSQKTKMAFILVKDNYCTYKEVSEIMNISTNTVDRHIQIAIQRIRIELLKNI